MTLHFLFTLDVDQDGITLANERNALTWEAVAEVPRIADAFARRGHPLTWFVRADNQLSAMYGSAAYLLDRFESLWSDLEARGHEIGWHPHVVRDTGGVYAPETDDACCADKLRSIHAELLGAGRRFTSARVGESFHGNASMHAMSELGLRVDSTAIPRRRRDDGERCFDWEPTPNAPYRPSSADYRVPGDDALPIVEMPMTAIDIQASYDPRPLPRYLNLAYRHELLVPAFERLLDGLDPAEDHFVVTILHPEEVRAGRADHPLYDFDLGTVERNMDWMLARAAERAPTNVTTPRDVYPVVAATLGRTH